jgi:hypothetical protein
VRYNIMLISEVSQSSTRMNVRVSAVTSSSDSLTTDVADVFGGYSNFNSLHLLMAAAATTAATETCTGTTATA